jgi:hypothetical protein
VARNLKYRGQWRLSAVQVVASGKKCASCLDFD